jgi:hypothetical protein
VCSAIVDRYVHGQGGRGLGSPYLYVPPPALSRPLRAPCRSFFLFIGLFCSLIGLFISFFCYLAVASFSCLASHRPPLPPLALSRGVGTSRLPLSVRIAPSPAWKTCVECLLCLQCMRGIPRTSTSYACKTCLQWLFTSILPHRTRTPSKQRSTWDMGLQ